ncbi:MAG: hypothetical protein HUK22_05640 [Thermoguttaceae bacterium]|nr:hypothetical protein [Thermoguttaceae bacterium]
MTLKDTIFENNNSGYDVYTYHSTSTYMYYSLFGSMDGDITQDVMARKAPPEDIFEYDDGAKIILENGVPVISSSGYSAKWGTFVGQIGADWYYVDKIDKDNGMWRKVKESSLILMAFNAGAADFGLTEGTVFKTAQNVDAAGARVSRVLKAAALEFDEGAYATNYPSLEKITLSSSSPTVSFSVEATLSPSGATASCQWYRVDGSGSASSISGATSATYTPTMSDVGFYLKVVTSGTGFYLGSVSAQTSDKVIPPPGMLTAVTLNRLEPRVWSYVHASVSPEGATCSYQWYRVDTAGKATAIPDATKDTKIHTVLKKRTAATIYESSRREPATTLAPSSLKRRRSFRRSSPALR